MKEFEDLRESLASGSLQIETRVILFRRYTGPVASILAAQKALTDNPRGTGSMKGWAATRVRAEEGANGTGDLCIWWMHQKESITLFTGCDSSVAVHQPKISP